MQPNAPLPELPKYKPTPLDKALKQKPSESGIKFQGVGKTGIRFTLPQRKLVFEDYLSFIAMGLFISFMSYLCWQMILIWKTTGILITILVALGVIAFMAYEILHFKETQVYEIQPTHFKIFKINMLGNKEHIIPIQDIVRLQVSTSSPTITFVDRASGDTKEILFMDYSTRREKEWFVMTMRSIIYNLTNRIV